MLREDRTAAEWKNVACATRRRRRILLRRILFYIAVAFLYYTRTDVRFAKEIFFFMTIECSQRVYSIVWFPIFFEQSFRNLIYYHL